jgi:copper/silver efflux system protein
MLDRIIHLALQNRLLVVTFSALLLVAGTVVAFQTPVDVLPDLTAPTVTLLTEAHGMAPEEVETLITFPIETALNGATGVRRVRSTSTPGLSTIYAEFTWGTDIYRARQVVNEKLQTVSAALPPGVAPQLAPISSLMGEILLVALTSDRHTPMELKETADFDLRRRLLATPGVAQISVIGGETRQYQIELDPQRLAAFNVAAREVLAAVERTNENFAGGVMNNNGREYLIRGVGRVSSVSDLEETVVSARGGLPVLVRDVATVKVGAAFRVGDASADTVPAVLLTVQKAPDANTLALTRELERTLAEAQRTLPEGMVLKTDIFRQADFIERAIDNIRKVLLEGAILVIAVLFLFLGNLRTTLISVTAIPLSLIFSIIVLRIFDISINTMTLGGMAIAIGVIVDDAIIDVENVFRRLKENHLRPQKERKETKQVVFEASKEIRSSIVNATLVIIIVFIPLFFLSGIEGRLLRPLGISYIVSIGASLLVALTLTPALCSYLLRRGRFLEKEGEGPVHSLLLRGYRPALGAALRRPNLIIAASAVLFFLSLIPLGMSGRSFLPAFNEGSLTVILATWPGTSLDTSSRIAGLAEKILLEHPNIATTARRTGRGEMDEHGKTANVSEIEARLEMNGRKLDDVLEELRASMSVLPGTVVTFGQPIGHRIDHMLSGTMANIAVKVYGPELFRLRTIAEEIRREMEGVRGIVDLSTEQQIDIPQVRIVPKRTELARYGLTIACLAEAVEMAGTGHVVTRTLERDREFDVLVRLPEEARRDLTTMGAVLLDTPGGARIPLSSVAQVVSAKGPNAVSRENAQRRIAVQANVSGRDLRGVFEEVRARAEANVNIPTGYYVEYGGQFESEARATRTISLLSIVSLALILIILALQFRSFRDASLVMVNLPLAFIGGILAVFFTSGIISVASLVGFITLFGIATRNGILLVTHYRHLQEEGYDLHEAVRRGSMERLRPVIMTALTAGLALVPFALATDKPGNEILSPLAVVILGGLGSATILNMIVLPSLYLRFGRGIAGTGGKGPKA